MQKIGSPGSSQRRGNTGAAQPPKTRLAQRRTALKKGAPATVPKQNKARGNRARAPGGVRVGAGRLPLYGKEKLDEKISTRFNGEQAGLLYVFCQMRMVNPNLFMRESALKRAGLSRLGIGLAAAFGTSKPGKKLPVPPEDGLQLPVKCTPTQKKALAAYCKGKGVDEGTFVRDSALKEAGLEHLTVAAQHRAESELLEKATGG